MQVNSLEREDNDSKSGENHANTRARTHTHTHTHMHAYKYAHGHTNIHTTSILPSHHISSHGQLILHAQSIPSTLTSCANTGRKRVVVATFDMTSVTEATITETKSAMAALGSFCNPSKSPPIQALRQDFYRKNKELCRVESFQYVNFHHYHECIDASDSTIENRSNT